VPDFLGHVAAALPRGKRMSSSSCLLSARAGIRPALLVFGGLVLTGVATADIASAQPINGHARWCTTFPDNGVYDCAYHTLQQCMAAALGVTNQCSLNPWYAGPPPRRAKRDPRR
jgi:uncharacterized protein DUF3551